MWHEDLKYALRTLAARPVFTALAVLSLALGIGLNGALFSFLYSIVLAPLPYPDSEQLVVLQESVNGRPANGSPQRWRDWQASEVVESIATWYGESMTLTGEGPAERVQALRTFGDLPRTLGLQPSLGRALADEDLEGRSGALLLTDGFWRSRFGGDATRVGGSLRLNGRSYDIAGVLPPEFTYRGVDAIVPESSRELPRSARFLRQIGRLRSGVSRLAAQQSLVAQAEQLRQLYPDSDAGLGIRLIGLREDLSRQVRAPLFALLGAVGFVLLSACLNIASLLLQRATRRRGELAVRLALGASPWSLGRLLLAEGMMLATLGGGAGLLFAYWGIEALRASVPADLPRLNEVTLSPQVVAFTIAISFLTALACTLAPALRAARAELGDVLRAATVRASGERQRLQSALVVSQIAISLTLLFGSALLVRTFAELQSRPLGFAPAGLVAFQLPQSWQTPADELNRFHRTVMETVRNLPGIDTVEFTDRLPLEGGSTSAEPRVGGRQRVELPQGNLSRRYVSAGYLALIQSSLRAGRHLSTDDSLVSPQRTVINETAARLYFPNRSPLGERIGVGYEPDDPGVLHEIVGVVGDLPQDEIDRQPIPAMYLPFDAGFWPIGSYVARTSLPPEAAIETLRAALQTHLPDQVLESPRTVDGVVAAAASSPRVFAGLSTAFAMVALLLAAAGIYGLLLNDVASRSVEIAIRMALGATGADVCRLVLASVLPLVAVGLLLGAALSVGLHGAIENLLYAVAPTDPISIGAAFLALTVTACVASLAPALRAARSAAVEILRPPG